MMKPALPALALFFSSASPMLPATAEPPSATEAKGAETVVARVNGMVCDFCARAVTKVFGREDAVAGIDVDLDAGAIRIALKPGETLADERIAELIRDSGYALVAIERPEA